MEYQADFLQNIAQTKATLKVITKTKNERFFIEKWIQHHLAIIGEGKLIIFDNMSDDEYVLNIYEKYKENILLIRFDFYHNDVHSYGKLKNFYDAISESTDFFTVLDSDEFLYLYDNNTAIHDTSILNYLEENNDCDFFAPCWLENIEGEEKIFSIHTEKDASAKNLGLIDLFHHGKPIINSKLVERSEIKEYNSILFRHTFELPSLQYKKTQTKFFIAHLKNLNKDQRILTNMNKLVSNKILKSVTDFEELFKINSNSMRNKALRSYIKQTQCLITDLKKDSSRPSQLFASDKTITLGENDKLYFSNKFIEHAFSSLLNRSYLDLMNYDPTQIDRKKYPLFFHWINRTT